MRAAPLFVAVLLLVASLSAASGAVGGTATPIRHVFVIMQENHSFDNYFGTYPTANGTMVNNITSKLTPVNGIPIGTCAPSPGGCVPPRLIETPPDNPVEGQATYENDYASGFVSNSGPQSMVYFDYHSIPAYWDYAEEYGIADNYFAAVMSMTTPNRLAILAGDTPVSGNYGPPPSVQYGRTIFSQLDGGGISWGYYDFTKGSGNASQFYPLNYISGAGVPEGGVRDLSVLMSELRSGSGLPAVDFVNFLGASAFTEHPPYSPTAGQDQVVSAVDAIMASTYWNSSVIFITWDEGGGFFDHVLPPVDFTIDHNFTRPLVGLGQRVPLLVISPFSKVNFVSHAQLSHLSLLRFIEYNWGLPPLTDAVAASALPLDFFNFSQSPRNGIILGGGDSSPASYPLPLQPGSQGTGAGLPIPPYALLAGALFAVALVVLATYALLRPRRFR